MGTTKQNDLERAQAIYARVGRDREAPSSEPPAKLTQRTLHFIKRDGYALCGVYPTPHHIDGTEPECSTCVERYRTYGLGPYKGPATTRTVRVKTERLARPRRSRGTR